MGMAGPGESISALLTCTVMYEDDLADTLLDRDKSPEWDSERTKLIYGWPTRQGLWDQYADLRRTKGRDAATEFYRARQGEMDEGAAGYYASCCWTEIAGVEGGVVDSLQIIISGDGSAVIKPYLVGENVAAGAFLEKCQSFCIAMT